MEDKKLENRFHEKDPIKQLKKIIKRAEQEWQKNIDNEKNPILKIFKQDYKDLSEIENKLKVFELKYGIELELKYPKKPKGQWGKLIKL